MFPVTGVGKRPGILWFASFSGLDGCRWPFRRPPRLRPTRIAWRTDLRSREAPKAQQTGKLVLVHFWTERCGPCKRAREECLRAAAASRNASRQASYMPGEGATRPTGPSWLHAALRHHTRADRRGRWHAPGRGGQEIREPGDPDGLRRRRAVSSRPIAGLKFGANYAEAIASTLTWRPNAPFRPRRRPPRTAATLNTAGRSGAARLRSAGGHTDAGCDARGRPGDGDDDRQPLRRSRARHAGGARSGARDREPVRRHADAGDA